MSNPRYVVDALLRHLSEDERAVPSAESATGRHLEALSALNGAMQEIYTLTANWFSRMTCGTILSAPVTVSATVNADDSVDIADADWNDWMEFAACSTTGMTPNRGRSMVAGTGVKTLTLLYPHEQTGTFSMEFVNDAVKLDADMMKVTGPVAIRGYGELVPVSGEAELDSRSTGCVSERDYGSHLRPPTLRAYRDDPVFNKGVPNSYMVDTAFSSSAAPVQWLRVAPAPDASMPLAYRGIKAPPEYGAGDLETDGDPVPVPQGWVDTVVLPFALVRFAASPYMEDAKIRKEAQRQYQAAMALVARSTPQNNVGKRLKLAF